MDAALQLRQKAKEFAEQAHAGQRRKGTAGEPFAVHLEEVATLLLEAGAPKCAVTAAYLHDAVEDTDVTYDLLEAEFGSAIAQLVAEVTDDTALPKEVRKANQVRGAAGLSAAARQLKLADKISNLRAMVLSPPAGWSHARRTEYVGWAGRVAEGLKGLNRRLDALFDETYRLALRQLAEEA